MTTENIELSDKIMAGVKKAVKKLYTESAQRNEQLVVADADGNVMHVDAKILLKDLLDKEQRESAAQH